uniref:Uncharacterized protein n=1 Tax=Oryza brachyantha TaxID=4533 RepID=J3ML18_ORYBR
LSPPLPNQNPNPRGEGAPLPPTSSAPAPMATQPPSSAADLYETASQPDPPASAAGDAYTFLEFNT